SDPTVPHTVSRRGIIRLLAGAALVAGSAGGAAWVWRGKSSNTSARTVRLRISPPEGVWPEHIITRQALAISPVGDRIAFVMSNARGPMVWVRRLNSLTTDPLPGTEGATLVFWSPDGKFIGFWTQGKL